MLLTIPEYVNCPLCFDDRIRPADLLPIHMFDFDVILGMDWLASHRARYIDVMLGMYVLLDSSSGAKVFWLLLWEHIFGVS
ncbi:reverse transcriptase domain-containing protein [Tanacetum coccineum]